jgi:hypothetical protein
MIETQYKGCSKSKTTFLFYLYNENEKRFEGKNFR